MFLKLSGRAVPLVLLSVFSLWMAAFILPLFYSLLFPNADMQHIVRAFEGKETLRADLAPLAKATDSVGQLKRAIQVGAYWGASAEYKHGESHTTKTKQVSYLAWFEKRSSRPTVLILTRAETDGSDVRFYVNEGNPLGTLRVYLVPAVVFACSLYWFAKRRPVSEAGQPVSDA
jgi:hypothetical protein